MDRYHGAGAAPSRTRSAAGALGTVSDAAGLLLRALTILTVASCGAAPERDDSLTTRDLSVTSDGSSPCRASLGDRLQLRVEDRIAYVEPQVLLRTGAQSLMAGSPTYEWFRGPAGVLEYEENRLFGVDDASGSMRAIRRPAWLGPVATVRVTQLDSGRFLWLFDEVSTMSFREMESEGVSSAEWDHGTWSEGGALPIPEGASYSFLSSSDLVTVGGRPRWILVTTLPRGESRVLDYTRTGDGWRASVLDTLAVEDVALAVRRDSSWVALTGPDPAVGARSVRVAHPDARMRRLHVASPGDRIVDVGLSAGATTVAASWVSIGADFARTAWAARDVHAGAPTVARIESDTEQVVSVALAGDHVVWLTHRSDPLTSARTLNVHGMTPDGTPYRIGSFAYPFDRYFAAVAEGPSEILVAGPETTTDPANRAVRSLFIRLSLDCR